jgi:dihydrofolate reductase
MTSATTTTTTTWPGKVICDMTVSLDGFISGPEHLDEGFMAVMDWVHQAMAWRERFGFAGGDDLDADAVAAIVAGAGAFVMGRGMFDVGEEPWGPNPPFRAPVFVVTHRPRATLRREGGTSFTFVTDGPPRALELACLAAGDKNVHISGGAELARQVIEGDLVDELRIHVAPVLLGAGMPLFKPAGKGLRKLEPVDVRHSPRVAHLTYRLPK